MGRLERRMERRRYRELATEIRRLQAEPGGVAALAKFTAGDNEGRSIDDRWTLFHAARRQQLRTAAPDKIEAELTKLHEEVADAKVTGWRANAIKAIVNPAKSDPNFRVPRKDRLIQALEIRDEALTNQYRVLAIRRSFQRWLLTALVVVVVALVVVLAHYGHLSYDQSKGANCTQIVKEGASETTTTAEVSADTTTTSVTTSNEQDTAQKLACQQAVIREGWVVWTAALAGAVGALASALRRMMRANDASERVPEVMASYLATFSRVFLGGLAGLTFYLGYRTGAIAFPNFEPVTVAVLGAFSFGFAERLFTIGEKPAKPASAPTGA